MPIPRLRHSSAIRPQIRHQASLKIGGSAAIRGPAGRVLVGVVHLHAADALLVQLLELPDQPVAHRAGRRSTTRTALRRNPAADSGSPAARPGSRRDWDNRQPGPALVRLSVDPGRPGGFPPHQESEVQSGSGYTSDTSVSPFVCCTLACAPGRFRCLRTVVIVTHYKWRRVEKLMPMTELMGGKVSTPGSRRCVRGRACRAQTTRTHSESSSSSSSTLRSRGSQAVGDACR